ncbi:MAG TPA: MBL fold metallo-hydrolase [Arthrobacter sp.]
MANKNDQHCAAPSGRNAFFTTTEPAPGVFFVQGPASNWIIVRDESGFILIDSGYPGDSALVLDSMRRLGLEPADAKAMLLTHGHIDHTGSAALFSRTFGTPILCSAEELAHVQGLEKHQVSFGQALRKAWRPKVAAWMVHAISAGAFKAEPATAAQAWTAEQLKALPGRPEAIVVAGHTAGNVALVLPDADAIATGDCLITGHPISSHTGPQFLDPMFDTCPGAVPGSLDALAGVSASVILPGHGPALATSLSGAISAARG